MDSSLQNANQTAGAPIPVPVNPVAPATPVTAPAPAVNPGLISTENADLQAKPQGIPPKPVEDTVVSDVPAKMADTTAPTVSGVSPVNALDFSFPAANPIANSEPKKPDISAPTPIVPAVAPSTPAPTFPKPNENALMPSTKTDYTDLSKKVGEINGSASSPKDPPKPEIKKEDKLPEAFRPGNLPKVDQPKPALPQPIKNEAPLVSAKTPSGSYPYKIEELLDMVVQRNASDLHLTQGYPAFLRIDSALVPVSADIIDDKTIEDLVYPLMQNEKREILEVNREVDFAYAYGTAARFRINAYYERKKIAAALRLIPNKIKTMEELGLPKIYHEIIKLPQGLVLVTGPTGSGKSTTLAAMINEINQTKPVHIVTIEDPIEYIYEPNKALIDQREMHEDTHSWEIALRSALRQDPDVVLVGEMRDFETIQAAITVAETGHLVFATLHTNSASQSIDRIIDVFPEFQQSQVRLQLSNVIEAVIAQRLVPVIGGGRRAVSEIMLATPAIRNLIREGKSEQIDNTIRTGADVGMLTLEQSLVKLVRDGKLSIEDAQQHTTKPDEVVRLIKG
jgi:twitching motility protein PilT